MLPLNVKQCPETSIEICVETQTEVYHFGQISLGILPREKAVVISFWGMNAIF